MKAREVLVKAYLEVAQQYLWKALKSKDSETHIGTALMNIQLAIDGLTKPEDRKK